MQDKHVKDVVTQLTHGVEHALHSLVVESP